MGGWGRVVGEGGQLEVGYTFHLDTDSSAVSSVCDRNRHGSLGRPRRSLGTTWIPINASQWQHRPCSAPSWFDRVSKKLSEKRLAIYGHILGVFG